MKREKKQKTILYNLIYYILLFYISSLFGWKWKEKNRVIKSKNKKSKKTEKNQKKPKNFGDLIFTAQHVH